MDISQILPDDPGNNPHSHAPFFINPGDGKAHIILLAGSSVVVAGVGHSVHSVRQADIDHALMYIRDLAGILALDKAFFQIVMAGVLESIPFTMKSISAPSILPRIVTIQPCQKNHQKTAGIF